MIEWKNDNSKIDRAYGRVGGTALFKIQLSISGQTYAVYTKDFLSVVGVDPETPKWHHVGSYMTGDVAAETADGLWAAYLNRLDLAPKSRLSPDAQKAIVVAIRTAAEDAAAETGSEMQNVLGQYDTFEGLRTTDYSGWAREGWRDAVQGLINAGILGPEAFE